jgi:hypothetical protein
LITQSFEWELITSLISFQKRVSPDEIGVRREEYMGSVERITEVRFVFITIYNVAFHVTKGTLYFLHSSGKFQDDSSWYLNKNFWDAIFVSSLALLVLVTGMRLWGASKQHHVSAHRTHGTQIIVMMVCILICEPSNFYAVFLKSSNHHLS